jgi:hypothetical protein
MDLHQRDQICRILQEIQALLTEVEVLPEEEDEVTSIADSQMTGIHSDPGVARGNEGLHGSVIAL